MKVIIKNKIDTPIYEQIKQQIINSVLDGELREGEQLPSIRQLAKDLKISVITTTKAYNELERDGYITAVAGKGYFASPRNNDLLKERLMYLVESSLEAAVRDGKNAGLSGEELVSMLRSEIEAQGKDG